jgi:hypothetical protein
VTYCLVTYYLCMPKWRPPDIASGERDEIALREPDYTPNIFRRNGKYRTILMIYRLSRRVAAANQEPAHNLKRQS